jgi:Lipid A 3-O-deacylase (PagL)
MKKQPNYCCFLKKTKKYTVLLSCFWVLFFSQKTNAQSAKLKGWSVEIGTHTGHLLRHSVRLKIENEQRVWAQEVNFDYQTWGKHEWNGWKHFPSFGLAMVRVNFTEKAHGQAFAALPNLSIPIVTRDRWDLRFRLGTGLGWVTRPFDFIENPNQNAIGSHLNNMVQMRTTARWRPAKMPHFQLIGGGVFTHFSNGGAHRPNFGLNLPALYLGAQYVPNIISKSDFLVPKTSKKQPKHRFAALFQSGIGFGEVQIGGGPSYPIYSNSLGLGRYFSKINRGFIGLDWERHVGIAYWLAHAEGETDESKYRAASTRWLGWVGDEFLFGPLGIHLQTGISLSKKSEYVPFFLYNKLAFRYYLHRFTHTDLRPWLGIYLKSHIITAEYISFNAGISF